jgi:Rrf2 family protein
MRTYRKIAYGVHATILIARAPIQPITSRQLAELGRLPDRFLLQVLRDLVNNGILCSVRGIDGGYCLARPANDITLFQIFEAFKNPFVVDFPQMAGISFEMSECISTSLRTASSAAQHELERITIEDLLKADLPQLITNLL